MAYSKMVTRRQVEAAVVIQAAVTHGDVVAARLEQTLAPGLGSEAPGSGSSTADLIQRLGRTLQASIEALVEADHAHEIKKAGGRRVRREAKEAAAMLYRELVDLRRVVDAVGGRVALVKVGLEGITTREPLALCRVGDAVHTRLPGLASELAGRRGLTFDATAYVGPGAAATSRLEVAREEWVREQRERDITLMHKLRAMSAFDTCYLSVARALEALFRLAGMDELADRVRPTRRRGQPEDADEMSGDDPDAAPDREA
jgi:hypothetical protein